MYLIDDNSDDYTQYCKYHYKDYIKPEYTYELDDFKNIEFLNNYSLLKKNVEQAIPKYFGLRTKPELQLNKRSTLKDINSFDPHA